MRYLYSYVIYNVLCVFFKTSMPISVQFTHAQCRSHPSGSPLRGSRTKSSFSSSKILWRNLKRPCEVARLIGDPRLNRRSSTYPALQFRGRSQHCSFVSYPAIFQRFWMCQTGPPHSKTDKGHCQLFLCTIIHQGRPKATKRDRFHIAATPQDVTPKFLQISTAPEFGTRSRSLSGRARRC